MAHLYGRFPGGLDIARRLQEIDLPLFRPIMEAIDAMGSRIVIPLAVSLCALFLWEIRRRTEAFFVAMTLAACAFTLVLKLTVDRPRPLELDTGAITLVSCPRARLSQRARYAFRPSLWPAAVLGRSLNQRLTRPACVAGLSRLSDSARRPACGLHSSTLAERRVRWLHCRWLLPRRPNLGLRMV